MGLFSEIFKSFVLDSESPKDKEKRINDKLFMDEAKAYGLTKEEIEFCKKSGITPEEWVEEKNK